jgi:hypothetical protein
MVNATYAEPSAHTLVQAQMEKMATSIQPKAGGQGEVVMLSRVFADSINSSAKSSPAGFMGS